MTGRILLVTNDFPPRRGGIESFIHSLCGGLSPDEIVVYTAKMTGSERIDASLSYPVVRDRHRVLLPTPGVIRRVEVAMETHGCDRVVFGAAAPLGLMAGRLRLAGGQRVIGLTHGHEVWWARVPGARALLKRIGSETDVLTYVSDACRTQIAAALSSSAAARMQRLAPGVDIERFHPGTDGSRCRAGWGVRPEQPVVLAASRLVRRKGQDRLIDAWPRVLESCPDAVLVVVGDGPQAGSLQRRVRRRGIAESVRMVGGVPWEEMPEIYAAADVFALPCRTRRFGLELEALGIVFLEAAATGLPVVVGRSGGAPETVLDGRTGYVVDPLVPAAIADRLASLLADRPRAQAMGERGRDRVTARFRVESGRDTLRRLMGLAAHASVREDRQTG